MTDLKKLGSGPHELRVEVNCCNVKKIDLKFYGIEKPTCKVVLTYKDQKYESATLPGLDPTWEEEFVFCVDDYENDKVSAVFYMGDQKLGDEQHFALNKLLRGKQTFKGLIVPGGKADFMFTALNFGEEKAEEENDAFMDFL
ncbi:hypothetical protein BE221DRAFT_193598 [Ostreococcus tauri]|uniref:C2 domain-containing protein n=1 Tax=Ostreococcus tauri TaxID=70448 RepID=A0A1Y5I7X7_OSTTA|nr:hypothetical protein BE221DRAFT_193598 [Ostreococcus tauri]